VSHCLSVTWYTITNLQSQSYGKQGVLVANHALQRLQPLITIPSSLSDSVHPLTASDFIHDVLLPQLAILLIREDLSLTEPAAVDILTRSNEYGTFLFDCDEEIATDLSSCTFILDPPEV